MPGLGVTQDASASLTRRVVKADPTIFTPSLGPSIIAKSLSIAEYVQQRMLSEAFDGPLTDYESSGSDSESGYARKLPAPAALPSSASPEKSLPPHKPEPLLSTANLTRAQKDKKRATDRRRAKHAAEQIEGQTGLKQVAKRRRVEALKDALKLDFNIGSDVIVTRPGWIGKRIDGLPRHEFTRDELVEEYGMEPFQWDGRTTHLLLDGEHHVVGVLVGQPKDTQAWQGVHDKAYAAMQLAASKMSFTSKETSHRRGAFPAVAHGISFGGGQEEPRHLTHGTKKHEILEGLMHESSIQRICHFASSAFETYGKRNYDYMAETVEALRASRDKPPERHLKGENGEHVPLRRPYDSALGVFPCRSLNLGEQSISFPHTDEGNLAQSWCSITPLGRFNPRTGGHIVLWDFGLVIEFPAGSTILIPSALIRHSNTSIQPGETRYSIIQYASGGIFRWVHNGFKSEGDWLAQATEKDMEKHMKEQEGRWTAAVKMFTKLEELLPKAASPSELPTSSTLEQ